MIAVSKLKPLNDIIALNRPPHNHIDFGENYLQELQQKAELFAKLPSSAQEGSATETQSQSTSITERIRWHFIGALQTNKCKPLARDVQDLWCVSSVDSSKKADELEKGRRELAEKGGDSVPKLNIHIQVNTSGEDSKSGVEPSDTAALCQHVREKCPHLHLLGLMTIGAIARSQASTTSETVNEDFEKLVEVRNSVVKELGVEEDSLELSMGMSADFEAAIAAGSGEVRVGSQLFGERPARGDAKVKEDVEESKS